ncbi:OstA-like protein [Rubrivirga sp. IMCC43871]|uniref:OstA-like protein n=1 Tax=Rubrivirga sp. IMCC43871 TaxID=3391575 RepID=UPI00398FA544
MRLLTLAACLLPLAAASQTRLVEILNADFVEVSSDSVAGTVRRLEGNVRLRQDTTFLRSRRAVYYESRGEVVLDGAVRVVSGRDTLTSDRLTYDSTTKRSVANGTVRLGDGESILLAPTATYDARAEVSTFTGGGRILHRGAVLTSPEGTYSSARRFATLSGPVTLDDSTGRLTADRGTYDARVRRADFVGGVRLRRPTDALDADSVVYFRRTERARAFGRTVLQRFGDEDAAEPDSTSRTLLFGDALVFDGQADTASARGGADGDPLAIVIRTDDEGRPDTTLARAPRIDAARQVVGADTTDVVTAAGGVRVWSARLAARADSARFVRLPDSLGLSRDRLALFGSRPSVWADGAQLTGDSLFLDLVDGAPQSIRVLGSAFAARLDSTLGRLAQIAGVRMRGRFEGDTLRSLGVGPNAQAVYYRASADGLLAGADELSADTLVFRFADGDLRELAGDGGIVGTTYGASVVPDDPRLPGFAYDASGPTRADVLGSDWEAEWLARDGAPPPDATPESEDPALSTPASDDDTGPPATDGTLE